MSTGTGLNAGCDPPVGADPYQIQPGTYQWIVINHGAYTFAPGLYNITGHAPVLDCSGANGSLGIEICAAGGYTAQFNLASNANTPCPAPFTTSCPVNFGMGAGDVDVCPDAVAAHCQNMQAGVFIQHADVAPTGQLKNANPSQNLANCSFGFVSGGGDETDVSGNGVSFVFQDGAGGFVSTRNVSHIHLTAPQPGVMQQLSGLPILFWALGTNQQVIHLDGGQSPYTGLPQQDGDGFPSNGFDGVIYTPSFLGPSGGHVEIDARVGLHNYPVVRGQIFDRDLLVFGDDSGVVVDFTDGWGAGNVTVVQNSVNPYEPEEFNGGSLTYDAVNNQYVFDVHYYDELPMNAWQVKVDINGGSPIFVSYGLWGTGGTLPPPLLAGFLTSAGSPSVQNWPGSPGWAYSQPGGSNTLQVTITDPAYPPNTSFTIQADPDPALVPVEDANESWAWGTQAPQKPLLVFNSYTEIIFRTQANLRGNPKFDMFLFDGDSTCVGSGLGGDIAHVVAQNGSAAEVRLEN